MYTDFYEIESNFQMGDHIEIMKTLSKKRDSVAYSVLTPNIKGLRTALDCGAKEVAIFGAVSETFTQKNINCSISESLKRFEEVANEANNAGVKLRGYVSCVVGCPYEGSIEPKQVTLVTKALLGMGCYEVSLGDTIGVGTAGTYLGAITFYVDKVEGGRGLPNVYAST